MTIRPLNAFRTPITVLAKPAARRSRQRRLVAVVAVLVLCLCAAPARAAIGFDAASPPSSGFVNPGTSLTWSHTTSGSNVAVVVIIWADQTSDFISGVTYNGGALTRQDAFNPSGHQGAHPCGRWTQGCGRCSGGARRARESDADGPRRREPTRTRVRL